MGRGLSNLRKALWSLAVVGLVGCMLPQVAHACFSPTAVDAVPGSLATLPPKAQFRRGTVYKAHYENLTDRYAHGVLGDALEPATLGIQTISNPGDCAQVMRITLDFAHVFEDIAPRLVDLQGDLSHEVITVQSHKDKGARLAVFGFKTDGRFGLRAATPYIGTRNRWLAPIGAADFDGDGHVEIAYVDRPHLAKTLRVWRFIDDTLVEVAAQPGFTNHRIGWDYIEGGARDCGDRPEMIVASGDWRYVMAVRLQGDLEARRLGPYSPEAMARALECR